MRVKGKSQSNRVSLAERRKKQQGGYVAVAPRPAKINRQLLAKTLTPREFEVASRLVRGMSYKSVAEDLYIGVETVRAHVKKIYKKMSVRSRGELAWKLLSK